MSTEQSLGETDGLQLELGQTVPLTVHYSYQGNEPLDTLCGSQRGKVTSLFSDSISNPNGLSDMVRRVANKIGQATCDGCDYKEYVSMLRDGSIDPVRSGPPGRF